MAELGPGPHRSGEFTKVLRVTVQSLAPVRAALIAKGMIYSPDHGDTAFTVPLFDEFMKRIMPEKPGKPNDQAAQRKMPWRWTRSPEEDRDAGGLEFRS